MVYLLESIPVNLRDKIIAQVHPLHTAHVTECVIFDAAQMRMRQIDFLKVHVETWNYKMGIGDPIFEK